MAPDAQLTAITCKRVYSPLLLNSWKEISAYVGRSVRAVQRWEAECALPVHRPKGTTPSSVFAIPEEINTWLEGTPIRVAGVAVNDPTVSDTANRSVREQRRQIKNALTAITLSTERALRTAGLPPDAECAMKAVREAAVKMRDILHLR